MVLVLLLLTLNPTGAVTASSLVLHVAERVSYAFSYMQWLAIRFRNQLSIGVDALHECIRYATRVTNDGDIDIVQDYTAQVTNESSLVANVDDEVFEGSMSDSACSVNACEIENTNNHSHLVEPSAQFRTAKDHNDECASVTLIAHCLAQYITIFDVKHQNHLRLLLLSDTVSWISRLFRWVMWL